MPEYESTTLWRATLASIPDDKHEEPRERLRTSFRRMRARAALLAGEIARDLPDYTLHDVSHLDGLWKSADLVAGEDYKMTPCEAFVLGAAFLLHDLGLSLAVYPGGADQLRQHPIWRDTVVAELREHTGQYPGEEEIDNAPEDIKRRADAITLRELHALRAEELPAMYWDDPDTGEQIFLLEDSTLRSHLGPTIGRLGHSHWWSVEQLEHEFGSGLGAPSLFPRQWQMDPLKVACLLRAADAAHIDASRAPVLLRVLRKPEGLSRDHWRFQEHLHRPYLHVDRLMFTAGAPFGEDLADAWWLCHDTLVTVDDELHRVDQLLADTGRQRFAVRGVAGIESPRRLAQLVPVVGWVPVDARVGVSEPLAVIEKLGGRALYGDDPSVALRELVQNAADAVRARRALEERGDGWGTIRVRIGSDGDTHWLEVEDNGVGMSEEVLTGPLLDFGTCYWDSPLLQRESPGLLSSGFRPIGRFGIGFFSVFMLGERVRVTTRRCDRGLDSTLVLEFNSLQRRPVVRPASTDQRLEDGGTVVRVWLDQPPRAEDGLIGHIAFREDPLAEFCEAAYPCLDVTLETQYEGRDTRCPVRVNDWMEMNPTELVARLQRITPYWESTHNAETMLALASNCRALHDRSGRVIGRAWLIPPVAVVGGPRGGRPGPGAVVVGGLHATRLDGVAGVLFGMPVTASRGAARPIVNDEELARWATEQAQLLGSTLAAENAMKLAASVRAVGGDTGPLPVAYVGGRPRAATELSTIEWSDEVLIMAIGVFNKKREEAHDIVVEDHVVATHTHVANLVGIGWELTPALWPVPREMRGDPVTHHSRTLVGIVLSAIAAAWQCPVSTLVAASGIERQPPPWEQRPIGTAANEEVEAPVYVLRRQDC